MEKANKHLTLWVFALTLLGLIGYAFLVWYVDPFVHFHKPFAGLNTIYSRETQSYVNAGIARQYDYDAVVIGSSVSENFFASDFDAAFGCRTIKLCFAGGNTKTYEVALESVYSHHDVKTVFYSLDLFGLMMDANKPRYDMPMYLYDNDPFNDVYYLLNIDVFPYVKAILQPHTNVSINEAYNWQNELPFSKERTLQQYERPAKAARARLSREAYYKQIESGMRNLLVVIRAHPETTFYIFYPPYSILWFDQYVRNNELDAICGAIEYSMELALHYDNVKIYSFCAWQEIITDLDNYRDYMHFSEQVNKLMVTMMEENEFRVTTKNYIALVAAMEDFAYNYDYEQYFEGSETPDDT